MFGSPTLEVVIGLLFVFLLLSLLATAINELIMSFLSFRGKDLEKAIKIMLDDSGGDSKSVVSGEKFYQLPIIHKLAQHGKNRRPSYLSKTNFSRALLLLLSDDKQMQIDLSSIRTTINAMPDGDTKRILMAYLKDAGDSLTRFRAYLETWYEEMMDRASGWYKRRVQVWLIGIGLILAITFNADTFLIAKKLSVDPDARQRIVRMATDYQNALVTQFAGSDSANVRTLYRPLAADKWVQLDRLLGQYAKSAEDTALITNLYTNNQRIAALVNDDLATTSSILGMGWVTGSGIPPDQTIGQQFGWIVQKLIGWLITAIAVSLGAPFWFDLLNKVMNIRGTGVKPEEKKLPVDEPPPAPKTEHNGHVAVTSR